MTRRTPLRRVSAKRSREMVKYRKLKKVFFIHHNFCDKCNKLVPHYDKSLHHWAGRVGALLCWEPGFRLVHPACHDWIETHRNEAVRLGLRAPDKLFNRPSLVIPKST